jgi:eukaryotic-like serine/threonine-protein kinase
VVDGDVRNGEILELYADMEIKKGVSYGREWKNSQGVRFVPLGSVLMSVWETRRRDYMNFCRNTGRKVPPVEDVAALDLATFNDGKTKREEISRRGTSPVVSISREEARAYCQWLTDMERAQKVIGPEDEYRLPTDVEWSKAVGLPMERGRTPAERSGRIRGMYPWGLDWPPPQEVDNLADVDGAKKAGLDHVIPGFKDRGAFTVKVVDLPPNDRGLCGLGGNVSEWVDTDFDNPEKGKIPLATVRGGNWRTSNNEEALSSTRQGLPQDTKRNTIGFRLVLSRQ